MTGLRLHPLAPESDTESSADNVEEVTIDDLDDDIEENNGKGKASNPSTSNGEGENSVKLEDVKSKSTEIDPKCKIEVRRWRQGSYTLLSDAKSNNDKYFLDGRLFFNCQDWNIEQVLK